MNPVQLARQTFEFEFGGWYFAPEYWTAVAIVFLLFLLVLTFARLRHMYIGWSLKGFFPILITGFFLAIIFEGFLIIGGRTLFTELIGWENAPKPIANVLDLSREKLVTVLGVNQEIPMSTVKQTVSAEEIILLYQQLDKQSADSVSLAICSQ